MQLPWNSIPDATGAFEPSVLSRWLAVPQVSRYRPRNWARQADPAEHRVLVLCTEQSRLEMQNGRIFSTGNHPVETLVPILHLEAAGFGIDIATPTGAPVAIERWALPRKDKAVMEAWERLAPALAEPRSLETLAPSLATDGTPVGDLPPPPR